MSLNVCCVRVWTLCRRVPAGCVLTYPLSMWLPSLHAFISPCLLGGCVDGGSLVVMGLSGSACVHIEVRAQ